MKRTDEPIIIEQFLDTSPRKAWDALSKIEEMRQWYFGNIPSFSPEAGFETKFKIENEGRSFTHCWKVTEVIEEKLLTYSWRYEEYPGDSFVTFELTGEKSGVRLRLTLVIVEDFPSDIPEFTRESCIAGWNYFLGENLKAYLEK